ncbi:MAG: hypothetical protein QNJ29_14420 [Rhizobiaceae bacterium]|nr:hypothetical protein [Rhizobiaceae bacterium]
MGYRGDYILAKCGPKELAASLDVSRIGDIDYVPDNVAWMGRLTKGWTVFVPECEGYCDHLSNAIRAISEDGEVITCSINETVMASKAISYKDGITNWEIVSLSDVGPDEIALKESGSLPQIANEIRYEMLGRSENIENTDDAFEYPIRVTEAITGYTYDGLCSPEDFTALHLVQISLEPHFQAGLISRCFTNSPKTTLIIISIVLIISAAVFGVILKATLEPFISFILGDWADVCLSNCSRSSKE